MNTPVYIVAVYFILVLIVGFLSWLKMKTPADYYVAGKNAQLIPVSGSLLATILGGSAILGTIELSQSIGWAALWFLFCASFGLFALAPLAKYVSRYGKYTLPGLLGHFFGREARFISSLIIPVAWLGIVAAQIIAAGRIVAALGITGYPEAAITSGTVFLLYTLAGGQVSILKTDMLQSVFIMAGLAVITIFALRAPESKALPAWDINSMFNESFSATDLLILVITYSVTFVVGPDIYSRIFCANSEKTATRSILIVAVLLIPVSFALTYLGIFANQTGSKEIISFAQNLLPDWFYGLFLAALLSAVMSSADTTLLTSATILGELFHNNMEEKRALLLTRIFIVLLGGLSIVIALYVTSILQSLLLALTCFSGAFALPMLAGLTRLKTIKKQVTAAILTGGIVALTGKIVNLWSDPLIGNIIIIISFFLNGLLLFVPLKPFKKKA
jgi:solute:Na+ symporter, SSS family